MLRTLVKTFLILIFSAPVYASDVCSLIESGRLDEARDSLSALATASSRNGDALYFQSLLEPDADRASKLMETALESNVDVHYQEVIYYRLAQNYLVSGRTRDLARILTNYKVRWEKGEHRAEMTRLSILLDELQGNRESAIRQCDRYLVDYAEGDDGQAGLIDKARLLQSEGKRIMSDKLLRDLSRSERGIGIPQSLYMLGVEAARRERIDDAVFYYNVYRESFPSAVGLDHLVDVLGQVSAPTDSRAEELTSTFYSVKVGVFSESKNAHNKADGQQQADPTHNHYAQARRH